MPSLKKPIGILAPGALADLILLDYHPTTPLHGDNLPWHILFGISGGSRPTARSVTAGY